MISFAEFTASYGGRRVSIVPAQVCSVQDINHDSMIRTVILCTNGSEHIVKQSYEQVVSVLASSSEFGKTSYWDDETGLPRRKDDGWYFIEGIWSSEAEALPWMQIS